MWGVGEHQVLIFTFGNGFTKRLIYLGFHTDRDWIQRHPNEKEDANTTLRRLNLLFVSPDCHRGGNNGNKIDAGGNECT